MKKINEGMRGDSIEVESGGVIIVKGGGSLDIRRGAINRINADLAMPSDSGYGLRVDPVDPTFGWRDIIGSVQPKASGAGSPTRAIYIGGSIGDYSFVANDVCDFIFHLPHDYVPETDLYFHIHWSHNGTSISGDAVFDVFFTYAKGHDQANFAAEKNITFTYDTVDIATTPRYRHRIDEFIISGPAETATLIDCGIIEPDGVLLATIRMTTLPTIGGSGKLFIHTCDIHYQSTNMATKSKSPDFYV